MGKPTFIDNVREWIAGIAWRIFLWAIRMSDVEYRAEMLEEANREAQSERETMWLQK